MYNNDQWKVMGILASQLPTRVVMRTKQIAAKFRGQDDADRIVRNSFRKLRDEGHIEIVERGDYRLTPQGAKYYKQLVAENFKPSSKQDSPAPKAKAASKAKKVTKKKVTKTATKVKAEAPKAKAASKAKKVTKKAPKVTKTATKVKAETPKAKKVTKKAPKVKAEAPKKTKVKVLNAFKGSTKKSPAPKTETKTTSNGNGVSQDAPKPIPAASTDGLSW